MEGRPLLGVCLWVCPSASLLKESTAQAVSWGSVTQEGVAGTSLGLLTPWAPFLFPLESLVPVSRQLWQDGQAVGLGARTPERGE